jgi:hypothetical protein
MVDTALQTKLATLSGRDTGFAIHGNRYIAHAVFQRITPLLTDSSLLPTDFETTVSEQVNEVLSNLIAKANELYPQAYLAQLFKNQKKLLDITRAIQRSTSH